MGEVKIPRRDGKTLSLFTYFLSRLRDAQGATRVGAPYDRREEEARR